MIKKLRILLTLLLFFVFFASFTKIASADCVQAPATNIHCISPGMQTACLVNREVYCCDSSQSCNKLQNEPSTLLQGDVQDTDPTCEGGKGIATAIGCIQFQSPEGFVGTMFKWALGIGGGIAFLLIIYGSFTVMTSAGNPDRLKEGQQLLTSAISGLILLVLSVFILRFIGIDILGLDSFGFGK